VVKELLEREEIDVNLADGDAEVAEVFRVTPLAMAAVMGKEDVFQRLFHHPKVDREVYMVFRRALIGGKASIVRTIIEALPNTLEVYQHDEYETALIMSTAYEEGSEEVVRYLLSLNTIPINYKGFGGRSAIHYAIQSGDLGKVRALLEHPDIDVNLTTIEYGCQSPLHCAADQERLNLEIVKALLAHPDIIVNSRDRFARTPLAFAAYNGQAEMVKLLLLRDGVDLFPVDEYGNTPLLIAAEAGESLVVSILLEVANSDVWHKNHGNRTALALAAESGHTEVVRQLLRPNLEVPRKIVREAAKHTKKALATTQDKLRTIPSYGKERHANVNIRRMEEAHKLLLAFLHS
jgi:ankyrin repeat protein